jgi:hypothetical protein
VILTFQRIADVGVFASWPRERARRLYNTLRQPVTPRVLADCRALSMHERRWVLIRLLPLARIPAFARWVADQALTEGTVVSESARLAAKCADRCALYAKCAEQAAVQKSGPECATSAACYTQFDYDTASSAELAGECALSVIPGDYDANFTAQLDKLVELLEEGE